MSTGIVWRREIRWVSHYAILAAIQSLCDVLKVRCNATLKPWHALLWLPVWHTLFLIGILSMPSSWTKTQFVHVWEACTLAFLYFFELFHHLYSLLNPTLQVELTRICLTGPNKDYSRYTCWSKANTRSRKPYLQADSEVMPAWRRDSHNLQKYLPFQRTACCGWSPRWCTPSFSCNAILIVLNTHSWLLWCSKLSTCCQVMPDDQRRLTS